MRTVRELIGHALKNAVKPGGFPGRISEHAKPVAVNPDRCPWCNGEVPEDDDATGEGPVYWTVTEEPHCSMECVVAQHRRWLKEQRKRDEASLPPGGQRRPLDDKPVYRRK